MSGRRRAGDRVSHGFLGVPGRVRRKPAKKKRFHPLFLLPPLDSPALQRIRVAHYVQFGVVSCGWEWKGWKRARPLRLNETPALEERRRIDAQTDGGASVLKVVH